MKECKQILEWMSWNEAFSKAKRQYFFLDNFRMYCSKFVQIAYLGSYTDHELGPQEASD